MSDHKALAREIARA